MPSRRPGQRERLDAVDALDAAQPLRATRPQAGHPRREEAERLLELGPGQVLPEAEVRAGTEGQHAVARRFRGDVEGVARSGLPVGTLGADRDDRPGREDHVAVLYVLAAQPGREWRDRLEPEHLVDRTPD